MMLAPLLRFNASVTEEDVVDPRGASAVQSRITLIVDAFGAATVATAVEQFIGILKSVGCPRSLSEVGLTTMDQLREFVACVNIERLSNNPRKVSQEGLVELLRPIL